MSDDATAAIQPDGTVAPGLRPETRETERDSIYLDGTLVLVGCGKAKRSPDDPVDLHAASVGPGELMNDLPDAETGPAWRAKDLYTSTYFGVKREFAEVVSHWAGETAGWGILSAEHGVLLPFEQLTPYDTTIDDLGVYLLNADSPQYSDWYDENTGFSIPDNTIDARLI